MGVFPTVFGYNPGRLSATAVPLASTFDYGWESPTALSAPLTPGMGYTVNIPATQTVDFVGTLNNGNYAYLRDARPAAYSTSAKPPAMP